MAGKIIQIVATNNGELYALTEFGQIWKYTSTWMDKELGLPEWVLIPRPDVSSSS